MRRREFIALLGGSVAVASPLGARAQQATPVIGFLSARSVSDSILLATAFRQGLEQTGYAEGRNVAIEYRYAEGQLDRLPAMAAELVRHPASVFAAFSTVSARAAQATSKTVPIVFMTGDDPVKVGLVESLNRPSGNTTGVTFVTALLGSKRLELLRALTARANAIFVLVDPNSTESQNQSADVQNAARRIEQQLVLLNAGSDSAIDAAFGTLVQHSATALLVSGSPFFSSRYDRIVTLAARHAVPTMYPFRDYVVAGGLISYGASIADAYRQAGAYVGRILRGEKPTELPVVQPTRFDLVINLKTAKSLGLEIPPMLLALADEVIE